jgi:hypothetical protein
MSTNKSLFATLRIDAFELLSYGSFLLFTKHRSELLDLNTTDDNIVIQVIIFAVGRSNLS